MGHRVSFPSERALLGVTALLCLAMIAGPGVCGLQPATGHHAAAVSDHHGGAAASGHPHWSPTAAADGHCDPHACCSVAAKKGSREAASSAVLTPRVSLAGAPALSSSRRLDRSWVGEPPSTADPGGTPLRL